MTTHQTIESARTAANAETVAIAEIDHATAGRCFVCLRGTVAYLRKVVADGRIPEVTSVIAAHDKYSPAAQQQMRDHYLSEECKCERCRVKVDGRTAYRQQEWTRFGGQAVRVVAYYCANCRTLLTGIGAGEHTAMQDRAGHVPSIEPVTKSDM